MEQQVLLGKVEVGGPALAPAHPELADQLGFQQRQDAVLRRAKVSGDRLVVTLALVLEQHGATEVVDATGRRQLRCRVCGPAGAATDDHYPCFTAQQAVWALEGVLR